jgi:hypothetical protein
MKTLDFSQEKTDKTISPYEYMEFGILYVAYNESIINPGITEVPYKIGITKKSFDKRYSDLKMPGEFEPLFKYRINDYKRVEKKLHEKFEKSRLNGSEWFKLSQDDIYSIQDYCVNNGGVLVTYEVNKEIKRIEMEDKEIQKLLKRMGKTTFVQYYDKLKNNSEKEVIQDMDKNEDYTHEDYTPASINMKVSAGKEIFEKNMEKRALTIISKSRRVKEEIRDEALRLLNVE